MKKIVGIIAALALASAVFADAPGVTPSVSKFDGSASIEYDIDLEDQAFGIVNASNADFEIQFVVAGDKATEGDGLWGDLKIKVGDQKVAGGNPVTVPTASIDHAKIHFVEGDFYANMDITVPGFSVGGGEIATATWSAKAFPSASVTLKADAPAKVGGFTLNFGLDGIVDFNLKFADNGVVKADAKKFAFGFDATLKAVDNLNLYAGVAYSTQTSKLAAAVKADYKLGLTDTLYLKPAVGFSYQGEEVVDSATPPKVTQPADYKVINAGFLLGWGTEGQEPGFTSFKGDKEGKTSWDNVPNKCADGFSVYAGVPLVDEAKIALLVSAYDSTLVDGLKLGAEFYVPNVNKFDEGWAADFAVKFAKTVADDWALSANFGFEAEKLAEVKTGFLWGCGVENGAIIDNTTLYLKYERGQIAKDIQKLDGTVKGYDDKGIIKIGAKIHF